ncbi:MAG: PD-(D/E)XK nuclease family protein [Acidobacteriota bacterium]
MDPFVAQLACLCTTHRTRAKWVFVPTHAIGRTLGDRLVLEGTDWANLRFVTPLDIALLMGAPFLVERGIDPSEEELGPALMMRLLLELPVQGGYFRPLADHPTLAQALWTTVRELRMSGVGPEVLTPNVFSSPAKRAEIVALLSSYERFLAEHQRADLAAVYKEALRHADWCPVQLQDCWTELPDAHWNPLQRAVMDAMPGERIEPQTFELPSVSLPRRLLSRRARLLKAAPATNPLAFLMTPSAASRVVPMPAIDLFHAGGREAEIEEVFRRVLSIGVSLDQVEIACASDAHQALIWEKALRHNWPVTLGAGIPATFTRPGRALLGLCDWIETDFSAGHFRRLLQSGDVSIEAHEGFTAGQAARVLARAAAGWGRATYGLAFGRLCKRYESRAHDPDESDADRADAQEKADRVAHVRTWISDLVASLPAPGADGKVPLQTVVSGALDFLERRTARSSALDHRAAAALREHVGELRALGAFSCALSEALRFVRERVQSLTVAPERPRPGHLFASTLSQAGYAGRPYLFIVGLEEGRVFSSSTEDAVLLDAERASISTDLRLSTDRIDESVYAVLGRLAVHGASATFSYSCRDTREFRDTYASWLMLQAYRLQQGNETLSYQAMKAALGEPTSAVPADRDVALSPNGWWLRGVVGTGQEGTAVLGAAFQQTARGRAAETRRETQAFTGFDGYVPDAGSVLDPSGAANVYSVTELEKAAECPFRFFLKRGLGVRPVDERERDKDVWLDPLTRGSELHDIYATFLRRVRDENRRPTKKDGAWLQALAQERLIQLHEEMPAATAEILARESQDFLADVELFVEAELEETTTAVGLEVSFGRPLNDDEEPLARAEPVAIALGKGLTLRIAGRIDRINQTGAATFEVLDYKTGRFWRDKWRGVFAGGQRLQHALYGLAAVELLKSRCKTPTMAAGVYYFSSHQGRRERVVIPAPTRDAIAGVLGDLRDVIITGQFIRTPDEGNCRYCDYAAACGGAVNQQAKNKLGDTRFGAFGRLAAHE